LAQAFSDLPHHSILLLRLPREYSGTASRTGCMGMKTKN